MGFNIVFAAAIPAYLAGGTALLMGAGWLVSLAVLSGTGVTLTLLLTFAALVYDARRSPKHAEGLTQQPAR